MSKTQQKKMERQMKKDRESKSFLGQAWCSSHDCRPGTCFPLHYPESFDPKRKVNYGNGQS